jgi:predicted nuclease of predicted toxin-antitoxin system
VKRILLDECIPRKFKEHFADHECITVPELGLAGKKNGELLSLAEEDGFQVFITLDRGIAYQQSLSGRKIAVVLIRAKSSRLVDLVPNVAKILEVMGSIEPGQIVHVP